MPLAKFGTQGRILTQCNTVEYPHLVSVSDLVEINAKLKMSLQRGNNRKSPQPLLTLPSLYDLRRRLESYVESN
jgi:hypothetical protein